MHSRIKWNNKCRCLGRISAEVEQLGPGKQNSEEKKRLPRSILADLQPSHHIFVQRKLPRLKKANIRIQHFTDSAILMERVIVGGLLMKSTIGWRIDIVKLFRPLINVKIWLVEMLHRIDSYCEQDQTINYQQHSSFDYSVLSTTDNQQQTICCSYFFLEHCSPQCPFELQTNQSVPIMLFVTRRSLFSS